MKKKTTTPNNKALDEFIGTLGDIYDRLNELSDFIDDHMGYNPDEINWGNVGTAKHYLAELTELTDMAFNRGEYSGS